MATNVFISYRHNDGVKYKEELVEIFDESTHVFDRSEDVDRSTMSEETIQKHLYKKLKGTSVTIVILTPNAINYHKNWMNNYDDWLYDELRYSLEDRVDNGTNGVVALYTDESKNQLLQSTMHYCENCGEESTCNSILNFENLVRKNMLNVRPQFKINQCEDVYDSEHDSYISLVHYDTFKKEYKNYIENAKSKRDRLNEFELVKKM